MTISECRDRIAVLRTEIRAIEEQFSDKNKLHVNGKRMNSKQWHAWRKNAKKALNAKLIELTTLRRQIQVLHAQIIGEAMDVDPSDLDSLLHAAFMAHEKIKKQVGVDNLDAEIIAVFDLVRNKVLGLS